MSETTFTWAIANMERELATGKITTVHYTVSATDGTYQSGAYGSIGLDGEVTIPYMDLGPETVVQWVKDHFGEEKVEEVEKSLEQAIFNQREPKTGSGVPWA
jgi:protoporphyrinogen oxidase